MQRPGMTSEPTGQSRGAMVAPPYPLTPMSSYGELIPRGARCTKLIRTTAKAQYKPILMRPPWLQRQTLL